MMALLKRFEKTVSGNIWKLFLDQPQWDMDHLATNWTLEAIIDHPTIQELTLQSETHLQLLLTDLAIP